MTNNVSVHTHDLRYIPERKGSHVLLLKGTTFKQNKVDFCVSNEFECSN